MRVMVHTYAYQRFDDYWIDADRHPYRRSGLGMDAAHQLFALHPGAWQVRQMAANARATAFWHRAIPVPLEEVVDDHGPRQLFRIEPARIEGS